MIVCIDNERTNNSKILGTYLIISHLFCYTYISQYHDDILDNFR